MREETTELFDRVLEYPDPDTKRQYDQLVGLDHLKTRLRKEGALLLDPTLLERWSQNHYGQSIGLLRLFRQRPPLFLFGGDVGTGKTVLARSFGDAIAREHQIQVQLFSLSLNSRGNGAVGEMTTLITAAFQEVRTVAGRSRGARSGQRSAVILLIDEADALAQSREFAQMHHEDRSGVNALIRGIDAIVTDGAPILVVMCTNRLEAIDPAVQRRAAGIFRFDRPSLEQRLHLLTLALEGTGLQPVQIRALAEATGPEGSRSYGFTYSDLTQRYLPQLVLEAFPEGAITFERAVALTKQLTPTTPFTAERGQDQATA